MRKHLQNLSEFLPLPWRGLTSSLFNGCFLLLFFFIYRRLCRQWQCYVACIEITLSIHWIAHERVWCDSWYVQRPQVICEAKMEPRCVQENDLWIPFSICFSVSAFYSTTYCSLCLECACACNEERNSKWMLYRLVFNFSLIKSPTRFVTFPHHFAILYNRYNVSYLLLRFPGCRSPIYYWKLEEMK